MTEGIRRREIKKVLLLNPPAPELVIRDYYCSKTTKSNYIFEPVDLLMQSGRLGERYQVALIYAVVDGMSPDACMRAIEAYGPDAIFFLSGAISWTYDFPFLESVKKRLGPGAVLVGSGDIFQEEAVRWLEEFPFIDAVVRDFANEDVLNFLEGREGELENVVFRKGSSVVTVDHKRVRRAYFDIPIPRRELFQNPRYRFSFTRRKPFATVLTDFGCPYPCTFCIMSTLGSKFRSVDSVMEELRMLKAKGEGHLLHRPDLGYRTEAQPRALPPHGRREAGLRLGHVLAGGRRGRGGSRRVREAGCHTLIFGGVRLGRDAQALQEGLQAEADRGRSRLTRRMGFAASGPLFSVSRRTPPRRSRRRCASRASSLSTLPRSTSPSPGTGLRSGRRRGTRASSGTCG
jgi:hypothetical protein